MLIHPGEMKLGRIYKNNGQNEVNAICFAFRQHQFTATASYDTTVQLSPSRAIN